MVLNIRAQDKFSFWVRMKRSATPGSSGSRTKDGEASMPRHGSRPGNRGHVIGAMVVTQLEPTRHAGRDGAEAPMHPLPDRLCIYVRNDEPFGGTAQSPPSIEHRHYQFAWARP